MGWQRQIAKSEAGILLLVVDAIARIALRTLRSRSDLIRFTTTSR